MEEEHWRGEIWKGKCLLPAELTDVNKWSMNGTASILRSPLKSPTYQGELKLILNDDPLEPVRFSQLGAQSL